MKQRTMWLSVIFVVAALLLYVWPRHDDDALQTGPVAESAPTTMDGTPVQVLDIAERSFNDHPALSVVFSTPLDSTRRYDNFLRVTRGGKVIDGAWVLSDSKRILYFSNIEPEASYTVLVRRDLPALNETVLPVAIERSVTTQKITPAAGFASQGSILPVKLNDGLPIMSVNVPEVDVQFLRVKAGRLASFLNLFYRRKRSFGYYELDRMQPFTDSVFLARFSTAGKPNARTITHIPVKEIEELQSPGLYIAVLSLPGRFTHQYSTTFFISTDLGLHIRRYAASTDVWLSSLATGQAESDVRVELYDRKGHLVDKVFTDAQGRAELPSVASNDHVVVANKGSHTTLLSFQEPALDLSEFDVSGAPQYDREVFIYSSRDLYRPGETADISILLRSQDGHAVKRQPLSVLIRRPDGRELSKLMLQSQELGYYNHMLAIPAGAQTGDWQIEVRVDPASKSPLQIYRLHVEEFLPERMKLELTSTQQTLNHEERLQVNVTGQYLYGAPATGNRFSATLAVRPELHPIEALQQYAFGDVNEQVHKIFRDLVDDKLDAQGNFQLRVQPVTQRFNSVMRVKISGSVYESGGRPVTRSIRRLVWPAAAMVGIRPLFKGEYAESYSSVDFELVRSTAAGELVAGEDLHVTVIREDRNYYWSYDESRGWHYEHSESQYPVFNQSLDIAAGERARFTLPVEYGAYRVEVADPATGLTTRYRFYAGWNWGSREQAGTPRPDKVTLSLDKAAYQAGDTVRVKVHAPHAGEGMLFVESNQRLWSKRITVSAQGTDVAIPLADDWAQRHNVYLSAVVFRSANARERITPNRAVGFVHVPMLRTNRQLQLEIQTPSRIQPEEDLSVQVKLKNMASQTAMVTVSAVDLGILNITRFATPDPWQRFFAKRRLAVSLYDVYGRIIENLAGVKARLRFGGDAAMEEVQRSRRADAQVQTVALFSGAVRLDKNGEALVRLPIPNYNGRLRVMAVAFSADRFASQATEVTVAAPVVAEITTPRFLSPGDASQLTLDVHNLSGQVQNLQLQLQATAPLHFATVSKSLRLDDQEKKVLRFDLRAEEDFGVGRITLHVTGDDVQLTRQWELGVRPAYPGITRRKREQIDVGGSFSMSADFTAGLMPKTLDGTLVVSNVPPLNIRDAVQGLLRYPYGCLEQTTSSAFPWVYIDDPKAQQLGLTPVPLLERAKRLDAAFKRLQGMQIATGGFGMWGNHAPEVTWLTPYVTDFLLRAREQGFQVPKDMLQNALENLLRRLQSGMSISGDRYYSQAPDHVRFATNSYAAYVLARVQRAPLGTLRSLYEHQHMHARSGLPLVHLGLALQLAGDKDLGLQAIREGITTQRDPRLYLGDYGSDIRDTAMMLALLDRHSIDVAGKLDLLFTLADAMKSRSYYSTQERLAIFLAGYDLDRHAEKAWQGEVQMAGKVTTIERRGRYVLPLQSMQLGAGTLFKSTANYPLYAELVINGYPHEPPAEQSQRVWVKRTLYDLHGKPVKHRALKVGEMLLVQLQAGVNDGHMEHALLVDLLPAGLEVENLNISQGQEWADLRIQGVNPQQAMSNTAIRHMEYRDDRFVAAVALRRYVTTNLFYLLRVVSPGTYTVPPPYVEDMYRPELRGIGSTPAKLNIVNTPG